MISASERNRRQQMVDYSIVSCELEGCIISDDYRRLSQKYINGEITIEELGKELRKNLPKG